jgi:signal transduction histidine kinase
VERLTLRQSLALWTLVPMMVFSAFVLTLSFAWAWRNVLSVAGERNAYLARAIANTLAERVAQQGGRIDAPCGLLSDLASQAAGSLYLVDRSGQVVCASQAARLSPGTAVDYASTTFLDQPLIARHAAPPGSGVIAAYAPVETTSWAVLLEEEHTHLVATTYSFLIAISALMLVGLVVSFWLLLIGFHRISWPLLAVTEQARRVAAGKEFIPPDVGGPAEVEALVAAFNHMVTLLRRQRDALHEYAIRTLDSQEEERRRISRDLHDETAQELVGLLQRIDLCRLSVEHEPKVVAALDELAELTDLALAGVRRMSHALRPLILEDLGLVAAVQTIGDDLEQQLPEGRVFCEVIGDECRLPPEVELTAFRIVQEALTNIRKHACTADRVYVTVQFKPQALQVSVEDNGCGFDLPGQEPLPSDEHLGLMGMKERAELLNGRLTIVTQPGEGTQVLLELPTAALARVPTS